MELRIDNTWSRNFVFECKRRKIFLVIFGRCRKLEIEKKNTNKQTNKHKFLEKEVIEIPFLIFNSHA